MKLSPKNIILYTQDKSQLDLGSLKTLTIDDEIKPVPKIKVLKDTKAHSSYDLF